ncbi:MAG TPA: zinc ribbon domain-containing protein, partial [Ktedonobacteraceae bacterium]|nr:zinc ribbon domain-containing protein [Ktedonobacteraceae bacterium]
RQETAAIRLKGKINQLAKEKAYAAAIVSVEVNPHGTSQYCSRCGGKGVRFTFKAGQRITGKGGKLFFCPACHYECHADFNASCNVHHSFFREYHWQPRVKPSG